jgi:hypothetical protein
LEGNTGGVARGREARGEEGKTLIRPERQCLGGRDVEDRWKRGGI